MFEFGQSKQIDYSVDIRKAQRVFMGCGNWTVIAPVTCLDEHHDCYYFWAAIDSDDEYMSYYNFKPFQTDDTDRDDAALFASFECAMLREFEETDQCDINYRIYAAMTKIDEALEAAAGCFCHE